MKRSLTFLAVGFVLFTAGIAVGQTGPVYNDIDGHPAETAIETAAAAGCFDGLWEGPNFNPNNRVRRHQLATVLANCLLDPPTTTTTTTAPPTTTTVPATTTTTAPTTTTTAPPGGLWIPGYNGPEVGTLTDPTELPPYTGPTSFTATDGLVVIESVRVSDTIENDGAELVFRNVWFDAADAPYWGVINDSGTLTVEDSLSTPPPGYSQHIFVTGNNQTLRRVLIHPGEDGIRTGNNSLYEQVHVTGDNKATTYGDAMQATGGSNVVIRWSYLQNTTSTEQPGAGNAALIATEDDSQIADWVIEHSVLEGAPNGTLQVNDKPLGCPSGFALTDVVITAGINVGSCSPFTVWVDVVDGTGSPIPLP